MKLLDLYSGAGGAAKGYQRAGFYVVGIDHKPMPRYCGDEFYQANALEYLAEYGHEYDVIHASPPCQFGSKQTPMKYRPRHPNLIPQTRKLLKQTGKPYIIENVENVRRHLINPVLLCGSMFGLNIWRHRYFEISGLVMLVPPCNHEKLPVLITGTTRRIINGTEVRFEPSVAERAEAIEIDWMTGNELDEAIPPAYTEFIGRQLLAVLERA